MTTERGRWIMLGYGVLMLLGGIGGYASKAHSRPSLISGIVSAIVLGIAWAIAKTQPKPGLGLGAFVALVLTAFFAYRVYETGKFMPAGGLCGLSLVVLLALSAATAKARF